MNGLDLFSGIGGIGLALEPWVRTVAYCERDQYAQGVLLSRMRSGEIDRAPIWDDVTTLRGDMLPRIDIISGGFPCQDISVAGAGKGLAGERSGLFFEIVRLARECEPRFIFLENVPAIRTRGGERVVKELAAIGYDCRWTTLSAAAVGAPHKRERWFLLAHANGVRQLSAQGQYDRISNGCKNVAHSTGERIQGLRASGEQEPDSYGQERLSLCEGQRRIESNWSVEPDVGRVVNGLPNRTHRIRCLGNSVVPLQVREAFKKLVGIYE
jgi:DNA (cytosine-5)-methyltransferase 1